MLVPRSVLVNMKRTPPETNMEPENGGPQEEEIPFGSHHFQVPAVTVGGRYTETTTMSITFSG